MHSNRLLEKDVRVATPGPQAAHAKPRAAGGVSLGPYGACARPVRAGVARPIFPRVEGVTGARERRQRGELVLVLLVAVAVAVAVARTFGARICSRTPRCEHRWYCTRRTRTRRAPRTTRRCTSLLSPMGNRQTRRLNLLFPFTVIFVFSEPDCGKLTLKTRGMSAGELEGEWRAWGERGSAGADECQGCGYLCVL
jgi:hypothetical protein